MLSIVIMSGNPIGKSITSQGVPRGRKNIFMKIIDPVRIITPKLRVRINRNGRSDILIIPSNPNNRITPLVNHWSWVNISSPVIENPNLIRGSSR